MAIKTNLALLCLSFLLVGCPDDSIQVTVCKLFIHDNIVDITGGPVIYGSCSDGDKEWEVDVIKMEGDMCVSSEDFRKIGRRLEECERLINP